MLHAHLVSMTNLQKTNVLTHREFSMFVPVLGHVEKESIKSVYKARSQE